MKIAFIRAGLWFCGGVIVMLVLAVIGLVNAEEVTLEVLATTGSFSAVICFFNTWYEQAREERDFKNRERELAIKERQKALNT